jgi:chromate transporter
MTAIFGAVAATIGLVTPSMIVILIVAAILKSFRNNQYVNSAFYGLRPASTGLITAAGISVLLSTMVIIGAAEDLSHTFTLNWKGIVLAILLWILTNVVKKTKKWHPIVFIGFSALVGIVFQMG